METFGDKDESVVAVGATGDIEGIWQVLDPLQTQIGGMHILTSIVNTAN